MCMMSVAGAVQGDEYDMRTMSSGRSVPTLSARAAERMNGLVTGKALRDPDIRMDEFDSDEEGSIASTDVPEDEFDIEFEQSERYPDTRFIPSKSVPWLTKKFQKFAELRKDSPSVIRVKVDGYLKLTFTEGIHSTPQLTQDPEIKLVKKQVAKRKRTPVRTQMRSRVG